MSLEAPANNGGEGAAQRTLGWPRLHLRRTDSTNSRARELALAGAPHGTLVTAAAQTAGRGRQGRIWWAPPGSSLLMSLLLRADGVAVPAPDSDAGSARLPVLLPLVAGVAVCEVAGVQARIKWPNDIVVEGPQGLAKLAGILVEGRPQEGWAVLGIGLNVAVDVQALPPELRHTAASMERTPAEIEPTLERLLATLEDHLRQPPQATLEAWRERDALRGRTVSWAAGRGRAEGIDGTGRLVVALAEGSRVTLDAGEVHLHEVG